MRSDSDSRQSSSKTNELDLDLNGPESLEHDGISRRAFFKHTGATLAALGLTEVALNLAGQLGIPSLSRQAKAYTEAIAQSEKGVRKLALLIGIDSYPKKATPEGQANSGKLEGCVTDVGMQRQLLIHRFGFAPADVLCLTNQQATRTGIYQAFIDHLYDQAEAGDVVVVHFSGYGAQVRIDEKVMRSLVPYDGLLPTPSRPVLNDILESELSTLLGQLKTKNITTVLDAGFVDVLEPLSGGLRSRARSELATGRMSAPYDLLAEKTLADDSEPFPGVLLRGAALDDAVMERQWNGFHAGAFTYVLTQYLWSTPVPITFEQTANRVKETLIRWGGSSQQPTLSGADSRALLAAKNRKLTIGSVPPVYYTPTLEEQAGAGVVQEVSADSQRVSLWLGGMAPRVLEYASASGVVTCMGRRLKLRSRDGLVVKAALAEDTGNDGTPLQIGQPVQEMIRVLPRDVSLVVAIDSQLERIERVDATSALSSLSFISSTSDTKLPADCLLAKPANRRKETLTASLKPERLSQAENESGEEQSASGYGLFSLLRSPIPGTLSAQDEAIKPAINRLTGKFKSLLALKMLRLTENQASSTLPIVVSLERVSPEENVVLERRTFKTSSASRNERSRMGFNADIAVGDRIRYRITNSGEQPLYYTLINVDPRERLSAFCPVKDMSLSSVELAPNEDGFSDQVMEMITEAAIAPGTSITIPEAEQDWSVDSPTGPVETYVICSTLPLINTFNTLLTASAAGGSQRINPLPEPLTVIEALLSDINQSEESDAYALNVAQWATLNFTYQAV